MILATLTEKIQKRCTSVCFDIDAAASGGLLRRQYEWASRRLQNMAPISKHRAVRGPAKIFESFLDLRV
jgi:hypothetical protein